MAKYILVVEVPDYIDQADAERAAESLLELSVRSAVSPVAHRLYAATCRGGYVCMVQEGPGFAELNFGPNVLTTNAGRANREAYEAGGKVLEFLVPEPDRYTPEPVPAQLPQLELLGDCMELSDAIDIR